MGPADAVIVEICYVEQVPVERRGRGDEQRLQEDQIGRVRIQEGRDPDRLLLLQKGQSQAVDMIDLPASNLKESMMVPTP